MQKFTNLTGITAYLAIDNVDTDMIIPKQFLKTITRTGLGSKLFYEMRYKNDNLVKDFILNQKLDAKILLTGSNFGCGSSREHAPWALLDFGISCVIAESFADIFYNNCFENGILPIVLPKEQIAELINCSQLTVELKAQEILFSDKKFNFEIDDFKKHRLLNGLDSIGLTMNYLNKIEEFEQRQKKEFSWL